MGKFPVKNFELAGNFYKKFQNGGKIFKHFQISGNIFKIWKLTFSPGSWHESRLNRGGYKYLPSLLFFPRSASSLDDELDEQTCAETNCCRRILSTRSVVDRGHCCCPSCTAPPPPLLHPGDFEIEAPPPRPSCTPPRSPLPSHHRRWCPHLQVMLGNFVNLIEIGNR
jgi:hypothetical protein